jgi:SRSO17 transposase
MYRTYDEVTHGPEHFSQHFPAIPIPYTSQERNKVKQKYAHQLLDADPAFARKHHAFQTKLTLAVALINDAIRRGLEVSVVVCDAWYLAPEVVEAVAKAQKAWVSILKKNRNLETHRLHIADHDGKRRACDESEIKREELIALIPTRAYHTLTLAHETTYDACTFTAKIPTVGKVRLVTGQLHWEANKIVITYMHRWSREVFYKDAKHALGFSDDQCRSETAIETHGYLVFCA